MAKPSINYNSMSVSLYLKGAAQRSRDLSPAFRNFGEYKLGEQDRQFETETDPFGNPWEPLSERTIARKRKLGRILKILQDTGLMRSRFYYDAGARSLRFGCADDKVGYHQFGMGVPERIVLGFSPADLQYLQEEIVAHIRGK